MTQQTVLICGGGIGGLAAALVVAIGLGSLLAHLARPRLALRPTPARSLVVAPTPPPAPTPEPTPIASPAPSASSSQRPAKARRYRVTRIDVSTREGAEIEARLRRDAALHAQSLDVTECDARDLKRCDDPVAATFSGGRGRTIVFDWATCHSVAFQRCINAIWERHPMVVDYAQKWMVTIHLAP